MATRSRRELRVPASFTDIVHFLSAGFVSRHSGITLRMSEIRRDFHPDPFVIRWRRAARAKQRARAHSLESSFLAHKSPRARRARKPVLFVRIKAVRGHSPSTVLYPVFLNLNLLFARRSSFGSSVSRGEFNKSLSCFAATGKTRRFLPPSCRRHFRRRLTLAVPTWSKFPMGRPFPSSRKQESNK